ncbi:hypothetical protein F383_28848 [Gossypium arboreum]|uniref:Uncharacterized protein n=1 Tax=Gossypium arboreum TaxID=29729 RepID=A0A0B0PKP0_GOSAR|nr:hypothetical protein F383_28848 [Gossypium arboreum]
MLRRRRRRSPLPQPIGICLKLEKRSRVKGVSKVKRRGLF